MPWLQLARLKCDDPQDLVGGDEAYIEVDNALVWGPKRIGRGEVVTLEGVVDPVHFVHQAAIDLYDEDVPGQLSQHLGRVYAYPNMARLGDHDLNFAETGFRYTLTIRVGGGS